MRLFHALFMLTFVNITVCKNPEVAKRHKNKKVYQLIFYIH
jgi:hypothetical protein